MGNLLKSFILGEIKMEVAVNGKVFYNIDEIWESENGISLSGYKQYHFIPLADFNSMYICKEEE